MLIWVEFHWGWRAPAPGGKGKHETGAVRIQYVCGYGDTEADVPALVKSTILFLVAHFDQNRTAVDAVAFSELPLGVSKMIEAFKYSAYSRLADPLEVSRGHISAADNRTWTE